MAIQHSKAYGIYHWDTFDNETFLVAEADTLEDAEEKVNDKYRGRIRASGADKVDIVDRAGNIIRQFSVG